MPILRVLSMREPSPRRIVVPALLAAAVLTVVACTEKKPAARDGSIQPLAHVQLDTNRAVEVIGLRWWTVDMIQDSLGKYAPGDDLESANTAANLRQKLHFADAGVRTSEQVFDENETTLLTIAVREPRDSSRVHYPIRPAVGDAPPIVEWSPIADRLSGTGTSRLRDIVAARQLQGPARIVVDSTVRDHPISTPAGFAFESPDDSVAAQPLLDAIAKRSTPRDLMVAIATLARSTRVPDRIVAVLILSNFPTHDEAWRALLAAAVDADQGPDATVAREALDGLSDRFPHPVDWTPVARTIHDVLDGTAVAAIPEIAAALARTGASPANATAYLAGGGEMLTAYLESADADISEPVHQLLVALRGSDLGPDIEPWRAWIRSL
jgi:hypothetical protein